MTKDPRQNPRLAEQFRALDALPMPPELAPRLRATILPARPGGRPLLAIAAAVVLVLVGFGLGRFSAPLTAASPPSATAAPITPVSVLGTTRDGNVVNISIGGSGLDQGSFSRARLRFSDGTDLVPEAVVPNGVGSVTLRYVLPSQFAFTRPDVRLELPLGTGLWVQSVDLR